MWRPGWIILLQICYFAFQIRKNCLGPRNLLVALAYEELAYATYVYEYSTGRFDEAKDFAEKSLQIMTELLPDSHLLLASSQVRNSNLLIPSVHVWYI